MHRYSKLLELFDRTPILLQSSYLAQTSTYTRSGIFLITYYQHDPCSNPVRAAYVTSLEQQISTLRDELATVYKTQGQNAQRLLSMTETLREKEEQARSESENLRRCKEEIAVLRRKVDQHNELMAEKDRTAQVRIVLCQTVVWSLTPVVIRSYTMRSAPSNSSSVK